MDPGLSRSKRMLRLVGALSLLCALGGCSPDGESRFADEESSEGSDAGDPVSTCDPLRQDCPGTAACQLSGVVFTCVEVGPGGGGFGEPCGPYAGPCAAGLECGPEVVVGCSDGFGCCTNYCDPEADECSGNLRCARIFEGPVAPGTADAGLCVP